MFAEIWTGEYCVAADEWLASDCCLAFGHSSEERWSGAFDSFNRGGGASFCYCELVFCFSRPSYDRCACAVASVDSPLGWWWGWPAPRTVPSETTHMRCDRFAGRRHRLSGAGPTEPHWLLLL